MSDIEKKKKSMDLAVPDYVKGGALGMEQMRAQDLVLPRILLMQGLSAAVSDGVYKIGDMVNSLTGELIAKRGDIVRFTPIQHYLEWIEWMPRDEGGGIVARSRDVNSDLAKRSARGEQRPAAPGKLSTFAVTEYHNFISAVSGDFDHLVVLSCAKSSHKKGKQLLSLARYRGAVPLFAGAYRLSAEEAENKKVGAKFQTYRIENDGWATGEEFEAAKAVFENLRSLNVKVDQRDDEPEVQTAF